jgi:hypothetical protein
VAHTAHDDQKARQTIALKQKTHSEFDLPLQLDTGFLVSDSEPFRLKRNLVHFLFLAFSPDFRE